MEIPYVLLIFLTYPLEFPQICFKLWTLPWKFLHFWFTFAGGHWKFHMSSIGGGGGGRINNVLYIITSYITFTSRSIPSMTTNQPTPPPPIMQLYLLLWAVQHFNKMNKFRVGVRGGISHGWNWLGHKLQYLQSHHRRWQFCLLPHKNNLTHLSFWCKWHPGQQAVSLAWRNTLEK